MYNNSLKVMCLRRDCSQTNPTGRDMWPVAPWGGAGWAEAAPTAPVQCFVSFTSRATRRVKSPYCACSEHWWAAGLLLCAAPHQSTAECVTGTPHCTTRVNTCCVDNTYSHQPHRRGGEDQNMGRGGEAGEEVRLTTFAGVGASWDGGYAVLC